MTHNEEKKSSNQNQPNTDIDVKISRLGYWNIVTIFHMCKKLEEKIKVLISDVEDIFWRLKSNF